MVWPLLRDKDQRAVVSFSPEGGAVAEWEVSMPGAFRNRVCVFLTLVFGAVASACGPPEPSRHGADAVVSAATPEAAAAGVEVLAAGGNAVDAAVAVSLALAVSEPAGSGIAGQAILLIQRPGSPAMVVNGTSLSPRGVPPDATDEDLHGHRAATVPSLPRALDEAWRRFGSGRLSWADLVRPAAEIAERGFRLGAFRHRSLQRYAAALRKNQPAAAVFLQPDGSVPPQDSLVRQPALAGTLRRLAAEGADDFYTGGIARAIARDMAEHGGWMTLEDLQSFPAPQVVPALHGTYRGWDVHTLPPPAAGWVVLQALNLLELGGADLDRRARTVWMAETLRAVHGARLESPVRDLVDYQDRVGRRTSKETARARAREISPPGTGETTHFVVVDADGLAVSVSQSLNFYFGAKVLCEPLGILYNDYMREFRADTDHSHPFTLAPMAMPYSSMGATILSRDGRPGLVLGGPGSRRIISSVVQVIANWVDGEGDVEAAVAAPRIHVIPEDDRLLFERRPRDRSLVLDLELRGFQLSVPISSLFAEDLNPYFGGVHAAALKGQRRWVGAADPRRDGVVRYIDAPN